MTILMEVLGELLGMFIADARLSAAVLIVVGVSAAVTELTEVTPLIGGLVLLVGCPAVVVASVHRAARRSP